ncbi:hypothetical protein [Parafrankia sp. EUN1f]|uniref:hypothetical protein n=1 Tax=Parafrankia sp. EUN1f TaxID=102897 RepID=UPI0001C46BF4|nr:hypothetical protein [Parafrankia sp. EUN1f]EFC80879.1 hypothetical protein FrEUN1fDRAFT_5981 [Parafrankia sp. EUN1f]
MSGQWWDETGPGGHRARRIDRATWMDAEAEVDARMRAAGERPTRAVGRRSAEDTAGRLRTAAVLAVAAVIPAVVAIWSLWSLGVVR